MTSLPRWTAVRAWGTGVRLAVLAAVVVSLAALQVPRPSTLCLLRGTTGIPCPFCGFTTSGVCLGHGDVTAAVHASPLAVVACAGFVAVPLIRRLPVVERWRRLSFGTRHVASLTAILTTLAMSELWQLARFGIV